MKLWARTNSVSSLLTQPRSHWTPCYSADPPSSLTPGPLHTPFPLSGAFHHRGSSLDPSLTCSLDISSWLLLWEASTDHLQEGSTSLSLPVPHPCFNFLPASNIWLLLLGFHYGSAGKESACNVGYLGSVPGLGRSPGGGHGNPFQYPRPGGPQSMGSQRAGYDWVTKHSMYRWTVTSTMYTLFKHPWINWAPSIWSLLDTY